MFMDGGVLTFLIFGFVTIVLDILVLALIVSNPNIPANVKFNMNVTACLYVRHAYQLVCFPIPMFFKSRNLI